MCTIGLDIIYEKLCYHKYGTIFLCNIPYTEFTDRVETMFLTCMVLFFKKAFYVLFSLVYQNMAIIQLCGVSTSGNTT